MGRDKKIVFIFSLVLLSAAAFLRSNYLYTTIVDDAYIFFRFAENLSAGNGIVWNIGDSPVEGYSSFLYLLLITLFNFLSFDPEVFSIITGVISSSLHLYTGFLIYRHFYPSFIKESIFTIAIIALSPAYLYWSSAGMETGFYSMLLLITVYFFICYSNTNKLIFLKGVLFGLLCITRYEAVVFFLFALFYLTYQQNFHIKFRISRLSILFVSGFSLVFIPYFLIRWNYFGYFLPNTFYAKTGGGIDQVLGGFFYSIRAFRLFFGLFWIVIALILMNFRLKMLANTARFLFSLSLLSVASTIYIGGDHFSYGRFFIPVLPLLFLVFPPALNKFINSGIMKKISVNFSLTMLFAIFTAIMFFKLPYTQTMKGIHNLFSGNKQLVIVRDSNINEDIIEWQHGFELMGESLKKIADDNDCIAAIPVGIIGYRSKIRVIDMVGIVDPYIAHQDFDPEYLDKWIPGHNKGDGKYIISQKPKYIQLVDYITRTPQSEPNKRAFQFKSIKEIWLSEEFHNNYKPKNIEVRKGWYYNYYERIEK